MAVADARLAQTRDAFDSVAASYHHDNQENSLLRAMRTRSVAAIAALVPPGRHLLDLGCGPGTDAETLARAGYRITAIDWSPEMVRQAGQRTADLSGAVTVRQLGIQQLASLAPGRFDAAYSNFGPMNCVPDLAPVAKELASRLEPGGLFVASVIGRVCPWELALFAARRDWTRASVRFARTATAVPLNERTVWTRYYSPAAFIRIFRDAGFAPVSLRALGLFVPPPYASEFADRHPSLIAGLQRLEDWTGSWPLLRQWGDHFLVALRVR